MVVALVARQVAVGEHVLLRVARDAHAREVAAVVAAVAVGEPVGDGEVEDLVDERVAHRLAHERRVVDRLGGDHADLEHVADLVVAEGDDVAGSADREGELGPSRHAAGAVVLGPTPGRSPPSPRSRPAAAPTVEKRPMPSPSASCSHDRRQAGSQSAAQPSSLWKLPGTVAMTDVAVVGDPVGLVVVEERDGGSARRGRGRCSARRARRRRRSSRPRCRRARPCTPRRPRARRSCPARRRRRRRTSGCVAAHSGCQSPGHPSSCWRLPAMVTVAGSATATPAGPATAVVAAARPSTTPSTTVLRHMCVTPVCASRHGASIRSGCDAGWRRTAFPW